MIPGVVLAAPLAAKSGEALKSGPWGAAMILLLCIAVYFLWRSMNKHLKKARTHFATDDQAAPQSGETLSVGGASEPGAVEQPDPASRPAPPEG